MPMIQNNLRLTMPRIPGETASNNLWRNQDLKRAIDGKGSQHFGISYHNPDKKKLFADLLKRESKRVMGDVEQSLAVQMPVHMTRLRFVIELVKHAISHSLVDDNEAVRSSANLAAYTVGDCLACLEYVRQHHRAPEFVNSRDAELAEINHKIDTLAGLFSRSRVLNAVLDEAIQDDEDGGGL